jgi:hypothetical protein
MTVSNGINLVMKPITLASIAALTVVSLPSIALAEISALSCEFDDFKFFITIYSDGTPARLGTGVGIGDRARIFPDRRTGALVAG